MFVLSVFLPWFALQNNFHVSLIINENCSANNRQSASEGSITNIRNLYLFVRVQSLNRSWTVRRNLQDFRFLDIQLHKCVFDRKHSSLRPLNLSYFSSFDSLVSWWSADWLAVIYVSTRCRLFTLWYVCGFLLAWLMINPISGVNRSLCGSIFAKTLSDRWRLLSHMWTRSALVRDWQSWQSTDKWGSFCLSHISQLVCSNCTDFFTFCRSPISTLPQLVLRSWSRSTIKVMWRQKSLSTLVNWSLWYVVLLWICFS